ncbi:hybrid sensor histidine kinase/response regulator [Haloarcula laminariae]|uniref:hybrid sensor histidine kinase/response regulator n=1 Tax=Haloarcula laminariae TaxID=2961577 RepID=UPI0021CA6F32
MFRRTPDHVRVVLVDDDADVAASVAAVLRRTAEFDVEIAPSASEARKTLEANPPDCVVSEYNLPGADGIEFCEAVRERYPELPIVLFTGRGSEAVASDAFSAGVTDYLRKEATGERYELLADRVRDAVEARRSERLAVRREELMGLTEFVGDTGGWELDAATDTALLTDGLCRLLGLDERTLLPRVELLSFVHPDDREEVANALDRATETGDRDRGTWRLRTAAAEQRVVEITIRPTTEGGDVRCLRGTVRDITERRRHEQKLQRYKRIFDTMEEAACIYDADGRFEIVNDYLADFYGTTRAELVGRKGHLIEKVRADADGDPYQELLDGNREEIRDEIEAEFPDHGVEVLSFRLTPLRIDGEIDGVVGVAHEVTDHRERERELQEQNERLDDFASIVSHDLRNPLNVASGHVELAREECNSDHLDRVSECHDRMERLIDELLTLARAGDVATDVEPVEIATAAKSVWKHVSTAEATLAVDTDLTIRADRHRLEQLLGNLFRNAVEHGSTSPDSQARQDAGDDPNGRPEVDTVDGSEDVTVTVGSLPDGFYVADDGSGVAESERQDVFDAGYSTGESGTGFGLKIVEEIATAHGWEISLTESAHGGARFEITSVRGP